MVRKQNSCGFDQQILLPTITNSFVVCLLLLNKNKSCKLFSNNFIIVFKSYVYVIFIKSNKIYIIFEVTFCSFLIIYNIYLSTNGL